MKKSDYEKLSVKNVLEKVFNGEASQLVARLIETKGLTSAELQKLKALIK